MNNIINFFGTSGFIVVVVGLVFFVGINLYEFIVCKNNEEFEKEELGQSFDKKV